MKYEPKWQPGPWIVDGDGNRVVATDLRKTIICHASASCSNPSVMADARLIAAAPALAEALWMCLHWVEDLEMVHGPEFTVANDARAALRLAGAIVEDEP